MPTPGPLELIIILVIALLILGPGKLPGRRRGPRQEHPRVPQGVVRRPGRGQARHQPDPRRAARRAGRAAASRAPRQTPRRARRDRRGRPARSRHAGRTLPRDGQRADRRLQLGPGSPAPDHGRR